MVCDLFDTSTNPLRDTPNSTHLELNPQQLCLRVPVIGHPWLFLILRPMFSPCQAIDLLSPKYLPSFPIYLYFYKHQPIASDKW